MICLTPCVSAAGLEGDADLQFLLKGGHLVKIRSSTWKKARFFKLQEDCKTFWHESHKTFKRNQTCECPLVPTAPRMCVCMTLVLRVSKKAFNMCQSSPLDLLVLQDAQTPPSNPSSAPEHVRCCASHSLRYCSHRQTGKILIVRLCVREITFLRVPTISANVCIRPLGLPPCSHISVPAAAAVTGPDNLCPKP